MHPPPGSVTNTELATLPHLRNATQNATVRAYLQPERSAHSYVVICAGEPCRRMLLRKMRRLFAEIEIHPIAPK